MSLKNPEHIVVALALFFNRIVSMGFAEVDSQNPRLIHFKPHFSCSFCFGRDVDGQPFIGVPTAMAWFFPFISWGRATIIRESNRLYLEILDPKTDLLLMAFGFYIPKNRLSAIHHPEEDISTKRLYMRLLVTEGESAQLKEVLYSMIPLREVSNMTLLDNQLNSSDATSLLERTGALSSVDIIDLSTFENAFHGKNSKNNGLKK